MMQQMVNSKKICFISCVNDEKSYEKARAYIDRLKIPKGFQVEILPMRQGKSMASAYNKAMHLTDAKYKIYLHQDVYIIHKNFILDIVRVFQENPAIGIAGMAGAKYLPSDGMWWNNNQVLLGTVYDNHLKKMREYRYQGNEAAYTEAAALDGLLLATQYDISWREDVFSGWCFYNISQVIEFQRRKYKVVVLGQKTPWCIHACGIKTMYNYDMEWARFLAEYKNDMKPLVSIMIPTYNRPGFFKIALESARRQTYENIEIIVCDNSTDEQTAELMENYAGDLRIRYFRNRQAGTKSENFQLFEKKARGEFLQWLMDDDVLEPDKIARMMQCFLDNPNITLATSNRRWIDEKGMTLKSSLQFDFGEKIDYAIVSGKKIGRSMLLNIANKIGEPSAVLFRRSDLENHYWQADCRGYVRISDVVMWLELLQKGDCACFQHPLSSYRRHDGQEEQHADVIIESQLEWIKLLKEQYSTGYFIEKVGEYKIALRKLWDDAKVILPLLKLVKKSSLIEKYKETIKQELSESVILEKTPLVSILIPTYNRVDYLQIALESVLAQTYKNIEIIISDNSENSTTEKMLQEKYLKVYPQIQYYHNEKNLGQFENDIKLLNMSNGEFVGFLMDDDFFSPDKVAVMMECFSKDKTGKISIVTSHRRLVDQDGNIGSVFGDTDKIFLQDTIVSGNAMGDFMLQRNFNCIGEPTTPIFRKSRLKEPFGVYNGRKYDCNVDQATWLNLLETGEIVFINKTLSYFRRHNGQQLVSDNMVVLGALDFIYEVLNAKERGFLVQNENFITALQACLGYGNQVVAYFKNKQSDVKIVKKVRDLESEIEKIQNMNFK